MIVLSSNCDINTAEGKKRLFIYYFIYLVSCLVSQFYIFWQLRQEKIRQSVTQNKELPKHLLAIDLTYVFNIQTRAQQSGFWKSCFQE